jgi:uncharacterized protein YjbI with pentapeptide repeats
MDYFRRTVAVCYEILEILIYYFWRFLNSLKLKRWQWIHLKRRPILLSYLFLIIFILNISSANGISKRLIGNIGFNQIIRLNPLPKFAEGYNDLQKDKDRNSKEKFDATAEIAKFFVSSIGTVATIVGGFFVFWNIRLTQTRLITERFSKAVEQLASDKIEIRLGAIYSLERLAKDSPKDHCSIMQVLASFIKENSPLETVRKRGLIQDILSSSSNDLNNVDRPQKIRTDIQAALTVIGRRNDEYDALIDTKKGLHILEMSNTNLSQSTLIRLSFQCTWFSESSFEESEFANVDFVDANFAETNFKNSKFRRVNLRDANLRGANLERATFYGTNFKGAILQGANVRGAYFEKSKNLTVEQILSTENHLEAFYDDDYFREELEKTLIALKKLEKLNFS